ncbi:MAG: DUF1874 domain-containing protein [Planctomycetes bacterium]|jgi:hypothetical protein|nr:DUF1874 domain-containing protein [Planctomycetota bacterium]
MNPAASAPHSGTVFILNTPILTAFGEWRFEPLAIDQAKAIIRLGFVSAVGHAASAQFLTLQLGVEVPVNRVAIEMQPGDQAVVLRLQGRLPEGKVLTEDEMKALPFELGLLTRS